MKLTPQQKEIKQATEHYVVARWGRRTGKDTIVKDMVQAEDTVIYPAGMHSHYRQEFTDNCYLVSDMAFSMDKLRGRKNGRVFIMEAAYCTGLFRLLETIDEYNLFSQVFLISTPRLQSRITSSGFFFDAICARLEVTPVQHYFYSQQGQSNNPFIDQSTIKQLKQDMPQFAEEVQGEFSNGQE